MFAAAARLSLRFFLRRPSSKEAAERSVARSLRILLVGKIVITTRNSIYLLKRLLLVARGEMGTAKGMLLGRDEVPFPL